MKLLGQIFAILVVLGAGWLLYEFVLFFQDASEQVQAALIGVFGVTLAAMATHALAQRREIASRHFVEKTHAYMGIFDLLFEIVQLSRNNIELTEDQMLERSVAIKRGMMVWASDTVLQAWAEVENPPANQSAREAMLRMERVFRAIRKDLGHSDKKLKDGDIVKMMLVAEDHHIFDEGSGN